MALLKKILAPTDFSDLSAKGVKYASQLAKDVGAALLVVNVVLLDESGTIDKREIEEHKKQLDDFLRTTLGRVSSGLKIRKIIETGEPSAAIVDRAASEHVDLIVTSTHGRGGISRFLIGSVTDKLVRRSACPVLVVPVEGRS
ncbi:MAG: universal stress protein [Candidatus Binatia bacterium]|jgi:nucleotide-binding universal stress UspA family protein